jgi:hypothetical protein
VKIIDFAKKYHACSGGVDRALSLGVETMQELWGIPAWNADDRIWVATRKGVLTDRELRLFACWCARQVWHLLTDKRSRNAVEVAEQYANGNATEKELAGAAARAAAAAAAAACDAAGAAARDEAWSAVRDAQSQWLLENTTPTWRVIE